MIITEEIKNFRVDLRHFERELEIQNNSSCCCGVTIPQCHTLMELDKEDNVSLKVLSERLFIDNSTLSRTIEGLVNLGLVDREIPENNRRTIRIKLTKQGVKVCRKINNGNTLYFRKVFEALSKEQLSVFIESFKVVVCKMIELNNKNRNRKI